MTIHKMTFTGYMLKEQRGNIKDFIDASTQGFYEYTRKKQSPKIATVKVMQVQTEKQELLD